MRMINGKNKEDIKRTVPEKEKNLHFLHTSLASVESLTMPLVQEIVLLADFKCAECQKRVGDIITKMNGETDSVVVSVLDKKVILTFTSPYSHPNIVKTQPIHPVAVHLKPLNKLALIRRMFRSSNN